jgi:hypothetical protein
MDSPSDKAPDMFYTMLETSPVAYVRPIMTDEGKNYGVYTSDGLQLAVFSTQDAAYFAAKQHDLEPVLIH